MHVSENLSQYWQHTWKFFFCGHTQKLGANSNNGWNVEP